jgi:hypothetical protein
LDGAIEQLNQYVKSSSEDPEGHYFLGERTISLKSILINAFDTRGVRQVAPKDFLDGMVQKLKQTSVPVETYEPLQEAQLGGKTFWKEAFVMGPQTESSTWRFSSPRRKAS